MKEILDSLEGNSIDPSDVLAVDVNELVEYYKTLAAERSREIADQKFVIEKLLADRKELKSQIERLIAGQGGGEQIEFNGSHADRRSDSTEGGP